VALASAVALCASAVMRVKCSLAPIVELADAIARGDGVQAAWDAGSRLEEAARTALSAAVEVTRAHAVLGTIAADERVAAALFARPPLADWMRDMEFHNAWVPRAPADLRRAFFYRLALAHALDVICEHAELDRQDALASGDPRVAALLCEGLPHVCAADYLRMHMRESAPAIADALRVFVGVVDKVAASAAFGAIVLRDDNTQMPDEVRTVHMQLRLRGQIDWDAEAARILPH
jgi:hypothetical protein